MDRVWHYGMFYVCIHCVVVVYMGVCVLICICQHSRVLLLCFIVLVTMSVDNRNQHEVHICVVFTCNVVVCM